MDFLLDEYGNYKVENGDFVIGDSREQEAMLIISANQGEFKHYPLVGCNPATWNNAVVYRQDLERMIKQQIEASGLQYSEFKVKIEAWLNFSS